MIGNLKADDKWCISNASLDNALLVSKFIEIIMLIK